MPFVNVLVAINIVVVVFVNVLVAIIIVAVVVVILAQATGIWEGGTTVENMSPSDKPV